mgnify:CR=1 FL=1
MSIFSRLKTYSRLGIKNVVTVALYRTALGLSYFEKKQPIQALASQSETGFFTFPESESRSADIDQPQLKAFGWLTIETGQIPDWLKAVDSDQRVKNNAEHWSVLSDFELNIGDIKTVWELSRLDWLFYFALRYLKTGNNTYIEELNRWLDNWCLHNPANQGVNWKCGQEAAIRVMHLAASCYLLDQAHAVSNNLARLIYQHLMRIAPTLRYAMAQDNNHGTSEAAALYIGSMLLEQNMLFRGKSQLAKWQKSGKYWLENRARTLIAADGCFSQNSVNYHRLMLDTLSLAEFFRQHFNKEKFSSPFYEKVIKATHWLYLMTDAGSGKAPILGLNDGARLLPVTNCDYLDYRPSIQWAYSLFTNNFIYDTQSNYQQLTALFPANLAPCHSLHKAEPEQLKTGYQLLQNDFSRCYIRTPNLHFRPSGCDALHIDFWVKEKNVFVGTGSFSYNCEPQLQDYFPSVRAHNTVQFDHIEQMPRLSRFLYSHWIKTATHEKSPVFISASYQNYAKHKHQRELLLDSQSLTVTDKISGFHRQATLRWHLGAENWRLTENRLESKDIRIQISSDVKIKKIALVDGYQSRYYRQKEVIPVLEVTIALAGTITTRVNWSK